MSSVNTPEPEPESDAAANRRRMHRAAALLGELLPSQTRDDTAEGWHDPDDVNHEAQREQQLRRDVPPHYGPD